MSEKKSMKRCPRCKGTNVGTAKTVIGTKDARSGRRFGVYASCGDCWFRWWEGKEG